MTARKRPIAPISGLPMPTFTNMEHADGCKRSGCILVGSCKVKAAPLPRAVRELLRDVVLLDRERQATLTPFSEFVPMSVSQRAAKLLGTTPAAIVARARKVRK